MNEIPFRSRPSAQNAASVAVPRARFGCRDIVRFERLLEDMRILSDRVSLFTA